ncbi:MAG: ASCH domain-containing protein [Micropruina sp.]
MEDSETSLANPASVTGVPVRRYGTGALRDRVVDLILSGAKTSTTFLVIAAESMGEALPAVGDRAIVVDSAETPRALTQYTEVRRCRVAEVSLEHALQEGGGYESVADWRAAHEAFWQSEEFRTLMGQPDFVATDDTEVVCASFVVVGTAGH